MTTQVAYFPMVGGENRITPTINLKPGELAASENYEARIGGGYRRIDGFERFDGQTRPSEASYDVIDFISGTTEITVGSTIDGGSSGASAKVIAIELVSGSWATSDAAGYLVLYGMTGSFTDAESLEVSAVQYATASGTPRSYWSDTDDQRFDWSVAAQEEARSRILEVPGSGQLRGINVFKGSVYAFRNNAGGTAVVMHKATAAGWVAQNLGAEILFNTGTSEVFVGETLTGGTSGATGVIVSVVVQSGDWSTNDATGYISLKTITGTFQAETGTTTSGSLTVFGAQTANTLPANGEYEFTNYNFYGNEQTQSMYGCNGVGRAFVWDGTGFSFIKTGMTNDAPTHIAAHQKHLFLTFSGGSLQHSSVGDPLQWNVITGAGELGTGDEITGLLVTQGILSVFNRNSTYLLYGTSSADWELKAHNLQSGAIAGSLQDMGSPVFVDDTGFSSLESSYRFGDFVTGTFSKNIQPIIDDKKGLLLSTMRVKTKSQYRTFFSDGRGIYATFGNGNRVEFTQVNLGKNVYITGTGELADGSEALFIGTDDGYVYQMDSGTNFDGEPIVAYLRLAFSHFGSPRNKKRFRKVVLEMDARTRTNIQFYSDFSYSNPDIPENQLESFSVSSGGGIWGAANWEDFYWSQPLVDTAEAYIKGSGINMGFLIRSENTYVPPHTIEAALVHYSVRGIKR